MAIDWSRDEVELVIADYFTMLADELAGRSYRKSDRRRRLKLLLSNRSDGSIEFKHANISAVLINYGLPYIDGYKPRFNYQQLLEQVVLERLAIQPAFFEEIGESPVLQPVAPPTTDFSEVGRLIEPPPAPTGIGVGRQPVDPRVRRVDFVQRDAENRRLGRMGEAWTVTLEERRLHDVEQRPDLAKRVEWVSETRGDGLGFDIQSFNGDGSPRLIEVKTTGLGKDFPFVVTSNEVRVSQREATSFHLYRVFSFSTNPRVYMLPGDLRQTCRLEPRQFSAWAGLTSGC